MNVHCIEMYIYIYIYTVYTVHIYSTGLYVQ